MAANKERAKSVILEILHQAGENLARPSCSKPSGLLTFISAKWPLVT